jgi:hypothetical protein
MLASMDHPLDSVTADGAFRHVVPMPLAIRVLFTIAGLFVIVVATWELWRGVWPLNITSPFFGLILAGAYSVGGPMTFAGIAAPATTWTVRPGRIDIALKNPFDTRFRSFGPGAVAGFDYREHEWDSRSNTWSVTMKTASGETFETRDFGSKASAEALRHRIEALFRG